MMKKSGAARQGKTRRKGGGGDKEGGLTKQDTQSSVEAITPLGDPLPLLDYTNLTVTNNTGPGAVVVSNPVKPIYFSQLNDGETKTVRISGLPSGTVCTLTMNCGDRSDPFTFGEVDVAYTVENGAFASPLSWTRIS